jgi:hypothetical protein
MSDPRTFWILLFLGWGALLLSCALTAIDNRKALR